MEQLKYRKSLEKIFENRIERDISNFSENRKQLDELVKKHLQDESKISYLIDDVVQKNNKILGINQNQLNMIASYDCNMIEIQNKLNKYKENLLDYMKKTHTQFILQDKKILKLIKDQELQDIKKINKEKNIMEILDKLIQRQQIQENKITELQQKLNEKDNIFFKKIKEHDEEIIKIKTINILNEKKQKENEINKKK